MFILIVIYLRFYCFSLYSTDNLEYKRIMSGQTPSSLVPHHRQRRWLETTIKVIRYIVQWVSGDKGKKLY